MRGRVMRIALIYNQDMEGVINAYGRRNREVYNPRTVRKVEDALIAGGHNVRVIDGNINVIEELQHFMPRTMEGERMGMVFNMAYGIQGENRYTHIPSLLEMLGIPYVGSSPAGHALALDKITTKILLQKAGLPTPTWWVLPSVDAVPDDVDYPVIVKPRMESVSFGLKICRNKEELEEGVGFIVSEFGQDALAEIFIPGREFCVGLLGNNTPETFPVLEIDLEGNPDAIQSEDDKKRSPRGKICPAPVDAVTAGRLKELAVGAFSALGLRDFSRVDFRLDRNGNPWILEINSMASLGATGSYVAAAAVAGYDFPALINRILEVASLRCFSGGFLPEGPRIVDAGLSFPVKIRAWLRSRQEELETGFRRLGGISAPAGDVDGAKAIIGEIRRHLKPLGFREEYPAEDGSPFPVMFKIGGGDPEILLLGRLDLEMGSDEISPFRESAGRFYGNGAWVHKGGLIVAVGALKALRGMRRLKGKSIGLLLTAHNELRGISSKKAVELHAPKARMVLGLHGAFPDGGVVSSRSGTAYWHAHLRLKGTNRDASSVLQAGRGVARLLDAARKLSRPDEGLIITPRDLSLKTVLTDPWASGYLEFSIRYDHRSQIGNLEKDLKAALPKDVRKCLEVRLEGGYGRPPMHKDDAVLDLYGRLKALADELDVRLREEHRWSAADIGFVADGIPRLDGLGPVGDRPTRGEEYILKHSILERAALLALAMESA